MLLAIKAKYLKKAIAASRFKPFVAKMFVLLHLNFKNYSYYGFKTKLGIEPFSRMR